MPSYLFCSLDWLPNLDQHSDVTGHEGFNLSELQVADDKVEGLFEKAKQAGATQGTAADLHPAGDSHKPSGFGGSARRLDGQEAPPAPQGVQQPQQKAPSIVTIKFYEGGIFTVNDGEQNNAGILSVPLVHVVL